MNDSEKFEALGMTPKDGKLTPDQIAKVKSLGCLRDKRFEDVFNVRVITGNGKITSAEHKVVAVAAEIFGSSEITLTSRMTLEIQGVKYDKIPNLIMYLKERGLTTGGTGAKVRPVVSCKGTTCHFGLIDTFSLSQKIHDRFFVGFGDVALPHKFKIAVGGCPNNCVKPDINDLGVIGQLLPSPNYEVCRGCKVCAIEKACPMKACRVENGKVTIDESLCNSCGRCREKCPFHAFETYTNGYRVYIGGRWGKKCARGIPLSHLFTTEDEVLSVIEKTILFFRDKGIAGERLADTVSRVGFEETERLLLSDELLLRRDEILAAPLK
jgi:dissimilatory sulfite reductase (desulfoviridin) alpha/beta subunit